MADGSSKFKNSINLAPQSSDPSNPAEGDVFRADGTSRAEGLWEYKDSAWTQIGSGAGGGTTINLGATVTAWQEYTPTTQGFGTITLNYSKWRRVGDSLEIQANFTTGTVTGSEAQFGLPSGLTVDSGYSLDDVGLFSPNATSEAHFTALATGGDSFLNVGLRASGTAGLFTAQVGSSIFGSTQEVSLRAIVKISGWSVADLPTSTDGVVVRGAGNGGTSITVSSTDIDFTEVEDTASAWNGTQFTAPETGQYLVTGVVRFNASGTRAIGAYVDTGGGASLVSRLSEEAASTEHDFSGVLSLNQGDVLSLRSNTNGGTLQNNTAIHTIHIQKLGFNTIIDNQGIEKNYLAGNNSSIEESVGDWVAYADAAATTPVDGVDGSPTITATRNTTTALRGTGDLLFTKDAANRQGEGISCPFTIDNADKAKKLTISFDYSTSANYADGDVKIFVYDLTNSNLIRVNGEDLKAVSGQSTHYAQFQTAPDSTNYRLIIHQSTTDATAYTINLDNLAVGPRNLAKGAIVTDWIDFTPVWGSTGTAPSIGNGTIQGKYRRVGDSAEFHIVVQMGSTTTYGTNAYTYEIPFNIDTDKFTSNSNLDDVILGHGSVLDSGVARYPINVIKNASLATNKVSASFTDDTASGVAFANAVSSTTPFTFTTNDQINIFFKAPIVGWSSEAVMSEDLGGRDIRVQAFGAAGTSITAGNDIDWATTTEDTTASWNGTQFTAPESGSYDIEGIIRSVSNQNHSIRAYIDNVGDKFFAVLPASDDRCKFSGKIYLNKGEVLSFRNTATFTPVSDANLHWIYIEKEASPQTILETETVAAKYSTNAGLSIPNASSTDVIFEDLTFDTHNAYNTSTGDYTVPVSGYYKIDLHITLAGSLTVAAFVAYPRVNGGIVGEVIHSSSSGEQCTEYNSVIYLNKGDVFDVQAYQNSGSTQTLATNNLRNQLHIARIK